LFLPIVGHLTAFTAKRNIILPFPFSSLLRPELYKIETTRVYGMTDTAEINVA
jgi:hypothetical protein